MQKQIDLLQVCHNISNLWEQVEVSTLQNAWNKLFCSKEQSPDDLIREFTNKDFVNEFALLNINLTSDGVEDWFNSDGPGYEHIDEEGIIDLVTAADEEDDCVVE